MVKNKRILFTGSNGFPFGSAVVQRQIQLANILLDLDYKVTVINNRGIHSQSIVKRENISSIGGHHGIEYVYTSILPYRSNKFAIRNFFKLFGKFGEFFSIFYYVFFKKAKYMFNNSVDLNQLKYYSFICRTFKIELIYDYVEMVSSINNRNLNNYKLKKKDFDNVFYNYVDKLIIISNFLENHINKVSPNTSKINIPPIIDFAYYDGIKPKENVDSFSLFCGSANYMDLVKFIIDAYNKSNHREYNYSLKLVINGDENQLRVIDDYIIDKELQDDIEVLSNLAYEDLVQLYKSAKALLIPIKDTLQDHARFPFKICEYTASKNPIITSDSGALKEFFTDNKNAFIAKTDDLDDFTAKLNLVSKDESYARKVGNNGYELGKSTFNYKSYKDELSRLLKV